MNTLNNKPVNKPVNKQCPSNSSSSPSSNMNISYLNSTLKNACMYIKYNNEVKLNSYSKELLKRFMNYMNGMIGAKTSANYHIKKVVNDTIIIPIYVYTNVQKDSDPIKLIESKIKQVRDFLEHFDWTQASKMQLWIVRSLHILGVNISSSFVLSTETPEIDFNDLHDEPIIINFPKIEYPKIIREKFIDNSYISYLSDPYLTDYGLFINLTVPFDDMGMSYNGLHLYEHLMTKAWDKLKGINLIELNGATWPQAVCFVYSIHNTIESMKEYAVNSLMWHLQSREKGFWDKHKEELHLEIERTVSETRKERTLSAMGRSDLHAYTYSYNTNIFEYWSNKPFEFLITGPEPYEKLKLKFDVVNNYIKKFMPRKDVVRPKNITFKNIPLDVLKMKKLQGFRINKVDSNEIKQKILQPDFDDKLVYGFDCSFECKFEDLSPYNSILHALLYNNRMFTDEELNHFLSNHVIPFSARLFNSASLQIKNAAKYLKEEKDNEQIEEDDDESIE